jgi:hypothetical protein
MPGFGFSWDFSLLQSLDWFCFTRFPMIDAKKPPKPKATIKDLLNSDQLVKGKVLLEKKLAEQKVMVEAMEFEMRNRKNRSK